MVSRRSFLAGGTAAATLLTAGTIVG